jgi:hypothetical protein
MELLKIEYLYTRRMCVSIDNSVVAVVVVVLS